MSRRLASLLLVTLLAFGLRAGSLTAQSLWRDEVDALCYAYEFPHLIARALAPEVAGDLDTPSACPPPPVEQDQSRSSLLQRLAQTVGPMVRQNGPLYFFLLRGWIALGGHGEYSLRFFSLWFGVLCVPLTYALGRRLARHERPPKSAGRPSRKEGRTAGAIAALLVACSPYLVWYSQEVKMYTLVPVLALLSLYALRRAVDGGGNCWWAVQVAATSLAFYTHIWSALLVPVQVVFLLSWWPRSRRAGALVSLALLTLPYLPLALWQVPRAFVRQETGFPHHTLRSMALTLLNGWSMGVAAWGCPWGVAACGGAALLGLAFGLAKWRRMSVGLAGWLATPLLGIWFVSLWQPLFTDRYMIWTASAFYLLAGTGLAFLWREGRWPAIPLLAAVLLIFGVNLCTQASTPIKSDLRTAAAWVESEYRPQDLIIFQIPHVRYTFDYYFPREYSWADGLYTNHRRADGSYLMTEQVAGMQMARITQEYSRVWLVASEVEMWDERDLVRGWLEDNGSGEARDDFALVSVTCYRLGGPP